MTQVEAALPMWQEAHVRENVPATTPLSDRDISDVLVVFVNHTECYWLKWLKLGFRHCFSAIKNGNKWVICDSLKDRIELSIIDAVPGFDLAKFYVGQGHVVLAGTRLQQSSVHRLQIEFLTCVTVAKRMLGVSSFWVWTPWQLFRFLTNQQAPIGSWRHIYPLDETKVNFQLDI